MSGYLNYSLSNNAVNAYSNGKFPKSEFRKRFGFDPSKLALPSEWHHTSCKYNRTDFYDSESILESLGEHSYKELINIFNLKRHPKWFATWQEYRRFYLSERLKDNFLWKRLSHRTYDEKLNIFRMYQKMLHFKCQNMNPEESLKGLIAHYFDPYSGWINLFPLQTIFQIYQQLYDAVVASVHGYVNTYDGNNCYLDILRKSRRS